MHITAPKGHGATPIHFHFVVTFLNPFVVYLSSGDLIGLSLLIFLQFLGVLHLFPFCFIQVALAVHKKHCAALLREKPLSSSTGAPLLETFI